MHTQIINDFKNCNVTDTVIKTVKPPLKWDDTFIGKVTHKKWPNRTKKEGDDKEECTKNEMDREQIQC